jgi:DNA-binding beta-propeller fold protein YncE
LRPIANSFVFIIIVFISFLKADLLQAADIETTAALPLFTLEASLHMPSDVAVGKQNRINVLDGTHGQVKVFNEQGIFIFSFGSKGSGKTQLMNPLGLDVDDAGNVYVADSGNHRIQIFDPNGRWVSSFDLTRETGANPPDPTDVAVYNAKDRCYVVDNDNHKILMFNKTGSQFLGQWGKRGEVLGKFRYPFFAAVNHDGDVAIVDLLNTRVQVFNSEGDFIYLVGDWGVDRGKFYRPKGVSIDMNNRIFVSDSVLGVVQIFDPQGNFLSVIGDKNGHILRFTTPVGIYVDNNFRLYVVEMTMDRVRVFKLQE